MSVRSEIAFQTEGEIAEFPEDSLLSQVTILGERPGGLIDAMVPVELINREEVAVDAAHVADLRASIESEAQKEQGSGQLSPVLIGEVQGKEQFSIIDGFHRDAALHELGREEIYTTIRRDSTPEDILDLRILTANTHTSVAFARVVEWIDDAWDRTPWVGRLSVAQAFALKASSAEELGLGAEEITDIKSWTIDKCDKWRMSPASVHTNLITAELADPELVREARRRAGGRSLPVITPPHLGIIATTFPHQYDWQQMVAGLTKENNWTIKNLRTVVDQIRGAETPEAAEAMARALTPKDIDEAYRKSQLRDLPQSDTPLLAPVPRRQHTRSISPASTTPRPDAPSPAMFDLDLARNLALTELQLGRVLLEASVLRGDYVPPTSAGFRGFRIDPADNSAVGELIRPVDAAKNIERFRAETREVTDSLHTTLTEKYGQSTENAYDIVRTASTRLTEDMRSGDLRLVQVDRVVTIRDLMVGCVRNELARRRAPVSTPETTKGASQVVPLGDVVRAMPRMSELTRRTVIMHGLLGVSAPTTAKLLAREPSSIRHIMAQGFNAIDVVKQQRQLATPES